MTDGGQNGPVTTLPALGDWVVVLADQDEWVGLRPTTPYVGQVVVLDRHDDSLPVVTTAPAGFVLQPERQTGKDVIVLASAAGQLVEWAHKWRPATPEEVAAAQLDQGVRL